MLNGFPKLSLDPFSFATDNAVIFGNKISASRIGAFYLDCQLYHQSKHQSKMDTKYILFYSTISYIKMDLSY